MYYVDYGNYPATMTFDSSIGKYCPTGPTDTTYCIQPSSGVTFTYVVDADPNIAYTLTATKGTTSYYVNKGISPTLVASGTPITAIATISGTTSVSQTLTAGALTPAAATASYQWQYATTAGGTYSNITGATSNTYIVSPTYIGKYFKVIATGTGSYSGTQTSAASSQVAADANWMTFGTQTWAKANLNVGTMITSTLDQTNNGTLEKYCASNSAANCTTYGGLYQWDEAMQYTTTEGAQGICPAGSHIPTDAEFKTLDMALSGMSQAVADTIGWHGTDEGTKLKSGGSSGLNFLLGGWRDTDGSFIYVGTYAYNRTSTQSGNNVYNHYVGLTETNIMRNVAPKNIGFSVRCIGN